MAKPESTSLQVVPSTIESVSAPTDYSREQIQLIKDSFAKGATDAELRLFIEVAKRKGLDIFSKQICLVPRWDKNLGREVKDPQTTVDGYRLIAERTGKYVPGRDTEYREDGQRIASATAFVKKLVGGEWHEIAATAYFEEYKQTKKDGSLNSFWQKMPHVMLGKCAESLALRKAFPAELSGIYTQEEMGSAVEAAQIQEAPTPKALPTFQKPEHAAAFEMQGAPEVRRDTETMEIVEEVPRIAFEQAEVPLITKPDLLKVIKLTERLEEYGVEEDTWRDRIENITGQRSRKLIEAGEVGKVLAELSGALNAVIKEKGRR